MKRLGLPANLTPHACRHTAATNMLYAGVPLQEVSYILGHADTAITAKTYSHALPQGGGRGWTPPLRLTGLDLLEAWYARAEQNADQIGPAALVPPAVPPDGGLAPVGPAFDQPALTRSRYN